MRWLSICGILIIAWSLYSCQECSFNVNTGERVCRSPGEQTCNPQQPAKLQIQYPFDLAVTQDGNTVYITNGNCSFFNYYLRLSSSSMQVSCSVSQFVRSPQFIYKIASDQTLKLLNIPDKHFSPCEMDSDIEVDNQDNLYIAAHKNIYTFSPQNSIFIAVSNDLEERVPSQTIASPRPPYISLKGPTDLYIDNDRFFYGMYGDDQDNELQRINRLELSGNFTNIYETRSAINFAIHKNYLYIVLFRSDHRNIWGFDLNQLSLPVSYDKNITEGLFEKVLGPDAGVRITHMRTNAKGELFVNDLDRHRIWKIIPHQEVIPFAGGQQGYKDGKGTEAQFYFPTAMSFDAQDNMYVADTGNHAIRKITPDGTVTTFYKEP